MKIKLLLLVTLVSLVSFGKAKASEKLTSKIGVASRYDDGVTFTERGIKFHVFLNGDFDFDTSNRNYNRYNSGVRIEKDYEGRIRRVGNVYVNYDFRGNVNRIGKVFIKYRHGNLHRVGNLTVHYDRFGRPYYNGFVKRGRHFYNDYDNSCNTNVIVYNFDDRYFYRDDFRRNYKKFKEDRDFLYYRASSRDRRAIKNNNRIIKRRKVRHQNVRSYKKAPKVYTPRKTNTRKYTPRTTKSERKRR